MGLGGCYSCIKYLMFAFNFIFWLIGCALVAVGIWALVDKSFKDKFDNEQLSQFLLAAAIVLIVIGGIIMFVGFCGCCGAIRESQCMLGTFFVFLFIFFAALVALGIWVIVGRDSLKDAINDSLKGSIKQWKNKETGWESAKSYMQTTQETFKCCGAGNGFADYVLAGSLDYEEWGCTLATSTKGCTDAIFAAFEDNAFIVAGVAIGVGVVMLLGMIFSMLLCCAIRDSQSV